MIVDIANNPRIVQVLGRIEELRRAAAERPESDPERMRLEGEVGALYVEVGHYTHWLMRQDPQSLAHVEEEARRYAETMGRTALPPTPTLDPRAFAPSQAISDEWADSDTIHAADVHALDTGALRALRDDGSDGWDQAPYDELFPELDPVANLDQDDPDAEQTDATGLTRPTDPETSPSTGSFASPAAASPWDDGDLSVFGGADLVTIEPPGAATRPLPLPMPVPPPAIRARVRTAEVIPMVEPDPEPVDDAAEFTDPEVRADWIEPLRELLDTLGAPERADDPSTQAACVSALGRATTNLEMRWVQYPDAVQQALLGYVGARARRLASVAPTDADIRLAIGRMERFMLARGLMAVPSLRRDAPSRDWRADERRFWAVLQAGL